MNRKPLISVLTSCFNSSAFIARTYASLKAQTFTEFEWVVVDDGSADDTLAKVTRFKAGSPFPIVVVPLRPNRGFTAAVREGVLRASGEFTFILDHDDELVPASLELLINTWRTFATSPDELAGVGGRCIDEAGALVGTPLPSSPLITNEFELRHVFRVRGELTGMVKTSILREEFSTLPRDMNHAMLWYRIARKYKKIFTSDAVRIYHRDVATSMTRAKIRRPEDAMAVCLDYMNDNADFIRVDPAYFVKQTLLYARYGAYARRSILRTLRAIKAPSLRVAYCLCLPLLPGVLLVDVLRRRI